MLYEPISSDNEDKEGGKLNGNCLVNLQNLTRSVEKVLLWQLCAQDKYLQMKIEVMN